MISLPGPLPFGCLSKNSIYFAPINLKASLHCSSIMTSVATETKKIVWLWTKSKDVLKTSVESGWNTFVFTPESQELVKDWASIAKIRPLFLNDKKLCSDKNEQVALVGEVTCAEDLLVLESLSDKTDIVVMNAIDWQIISSENLVAYFQNIQTSLFAIARSAKEAQVFLESLEKGTDGIVLQTEDVAEVFELKAYLASHAKEKIVLSSAIVKRVEHIGMGDRVCVDLCSLLNPGEGLLVGSFARALFLVHSECLETNYVASRPFRVNAGPVHAYVARPGGKTSYLAELQSGMQVLVVDAYGLQRSAAVGRVKIETRPLILVEAVLENNSSTTCSLLLQNAETVSLIHSPTGMDTNMSLAIPVTSLKAGDRVLVSVQDGARHTDEDGVKTFLFQVVVDYAKLGLYEWSKITVAFQDGVTKSKATPEHQKGNKKPLFELGIIIAFLTPFLDRMAAYYSQFNYGNYLVTRLAIEPLFDLEHLLAPLGASRAVRLR